MAKRPARGEPPAQPWSVRMVRSVMQRNAPHRWHYEYGLMHRAIEHVWRKTGDKAYYDHVARQVDEFVCHDGSIATYRPDEYNLDQINAGRSLFTLYGVTGNEKYKKAAYALREQLRTQPRNSENGFWHKKIYPYQMWLDSIYMASPFYAQFGQTFGEPAAFDDVALQITLIEKHARDATTGLLYHAWDESKQMGWANPVTGCSPHFWGRAVGWYAMAMLDVLDYFPQKHPKRAEIIAAFQRLAPAIAAVQDRESGLWWQVLDQGGRAGNYLEASASSMYVYAFCKGVRLGLLPSSYRALAERGYQGILERMIRVDEQGLVNLEHICGACGLGGVPYRDGTYEYYVWEKVVTNDYKGVGSFVLASLEMETKE